MYTTLNYVKLNIYLNITSIQNDADSKHLISSGYEEYLISIDNNGEDYSRKNWEEF